MASSLTFHLFLCNARQMTWLWFIFSNGLCRDQELNPRQQSCTNKWPLSGLFTDWASVSTTFLGNFWWICRQPLEKAETKSCEKFLKMIFLSDRVPQHSKKFMQRLSDGSGKSFFSLGSNLENEESPRQIRVSSSNEGLFQIKSCTLHLFYALS